MICWQWSFAIPSFVTLCLRIKKVGCLEETLVHTVKLNRQSWNLLYLLYKLDLHAFAYPREICRFFSPPNVNIYY